jgi:hypothetical protein
LDTEFVVIEGGNHAQFGDYGFSPAIMTLISRQDQQSQVVDTTVNSWKLCQIALSAEQEYLGKGYAIVS